MTSCAYRPSYQSTTPYESLTYTNIQNAPSDYKFSLRNGWSYYNGGIEPDPVAWYPEYDFLRETHLGPDGESRHMLCRWYEKLHATRPESAVIAIHGASSVPDLWFADSQASGSWGMNYLNFGGTALFADGHDVFAPHVTHVAKFNCAQARIAKAFGDDGHSLDLRRCIALFNHLKGAGYTTIHITGCSYGAYLSVLLARHFKDDPCLGVSVAIEGWLPSRAYIGAPDAYALFNWNWENMFPGETKTSFLDLPPRTYVAYGSCSTNPSQYPGLTDNYTPWYAMLPPDRVVTYTGAHEYRHDVFTEALSRSAG